MTPYLIDALSRLSPLGRHELALVSATATALIAQADAAPAIPLGLSPASLALPDHRPAILAPFAKTPRTRQSTLRATLDGVDAGTVPRDLVGLPLIGGLALSLEPSSLFARADFRALWRPGRRLLVYLAGSRSIATLVRCLHRPGTPAGRRLCAFKVGTHTAGEDLGVRLRRLSAERYGSLWRDGSRLVDDPTWGDWAPEPLDPGAIEPAPSSPVRLGIDAIEVVLPETMTQAGFDQRLGKLLSPATLAAFALSPAGRELCVACGEDPARFVRYSAQGKGRSRRATEITLIGRHDIGRLVHLIEQLVLEHVLAEQTE